jgi:hypothetical protein
MATELWAPGGDGLFIRGFEVGETATDSDLCIWRVHVCPACHLEFVIFYKEKDGTDLHHETLHCPHGVGCEGSIGTELPAQYLVLPAIAA